MDVSSATVAVVNHEALAAEDRNQSHITFSSASYTLEKTKTDVKSGIEAGAETSVWRNAQGDAIVFVKISAFVSYNKLLMSSQLHPVEKKVHAISGSHTVSLDPKGRVDAAQGFYEHQIYRADEVQCAYVQSYWGDKSFGGVDVGRAARSTVTMVGNHMFQANFCDQRKKMGSNEVSEFLSSIKLRDAYWPVDLFAGDTDSAENGVPGTKTTLDNPATVESKRGSKLEGVSGT